MSAQTTSHYNDPIASYQPKHAVLGYQLIVSRKQWRSKVATVTQYFDGSRRNSASRVGPASKAHLIWLKLILDWLASKPNHRTHTRGSHKQLRNLLIAPNSGHQQLRSHKKPPKTTTKPPDLAQIEPTTTSSHARWEVDARAYIVDDSGTMKK